MGVRENILEKRTHKRYTYTMNHHECMYQVGTALEFTVVSGVANSTCKRGSHAARACWMCKKK